MQSKPDAESLLRIPKFHIAKQYSSGDMPSEFEEGQFTLVYSIVRNIMRGKAAACPQPLSIQDVWMIRLVSDSRMMERIVLNFLPNSTESCYKTISHFLFRDLVKLPC